MLKNVDVEIKKYVELIRHITELFMVYILRYPYKGIELNRLFLNIKKLIKFKTMPNTLNGVIK